MHDPDVGKGSEEESSAGLAAGKGGDVGCRVGACQIVEEGAADVAGASGSVLSCISRGPKVLCEE